MSLNNKGDCLLGNPHGPTAPTNRKAQSSEPPNPDPEAITLRRKTPRRTQNTDDIPTIGVFRSRLKREGKDRKGRLALSPEGLASRSTLRLLYLVGSNVDELLAGRRRWRPRTAGGMWLPDPEGKVAWELGCV